jgi:hypothetical protein
MDILKRAIIEPDCVEFNSISEDKTPITVQLFREGLIPLSAFTSAGGAK